MPSDKWNGCIYHWLRKSALRVMRIDGMALDDRDYKKSLRVWTFAGAPAGTTGICWQNVLDAGGRCDPPNGKESDRGRAASLQ